MRLEIVLIGPLLLGCGSSNNLSIDASIVDADTDAPPPVTIWPGPCTVSTRDVNGDLLTTETRVYNQSLELIEQTFDDDGDGGTDRISRRTNNSFGVATVDEYKTPSLGNLHKRFTYSYDAGRLDNIVIDQIPDGATFDGYIEVTHTTNTQIQERYNPDENGPQVHKTVMTYHDSGALLQRDFYNVSPFTTTYRVISFTLSSQHQRRIARSDVHSPANPLFANFDDVFEYEFPPDEGNLLQIVRDLDQDGSTDQIITHSYECFE